ncbi:MAG: hypothetical protein ACK5CA_06115 [Cyanobacteriota bacterium]|jgi:type II secretory pathway pseudopilin PulG
MNSPLFSARLSLFLLTRRRRQGFSMLEVLVALFAAFFFLMGTMNAMVVAAVMQVKAERQAQGLYWIQQDLEAVRAAAATFSGTCGSMGSGLDSSLGTISPATKTLVSKSYVIERTETASGNVLQLSYRVGENNGSNAIATTTNAVVATLYTEVLPNAALSCP